MLQPQLKGSFASSQTHFHQLDPYFGTAVACWVVGYRVLLHSLFKPLASQRHQRFTHEGNDGLLHQRGRHQFAHAVAALKIPLGAEDEHRLRALNIARQIRNVLKIVHAAVQGSEPWPSPTVCKVKAIAKV